MIQFKKYEKQYQNDFLKLLTDAQVMAKVDGALSEKQAHQLFEQFLQPAPEEKEEIFAIIGPQEGAYIGHVALLKRDCENSREILFYLRPEYWGKNMGTLAAEMILDWGFRKIGLESVVATVDFDNEASVRILENLKMIRTRDETDSKGRWFEYAIKREDYLLSHPLALPIHLDHYDDMDLKSEEFQRCAKEIFDLYGGDGKLPLETFESGSTPVFGNGKSICKMFPPIFKEHFLVEKASLVHLENHGFHQAPRLLGSGEHGKWFYLVFERAKGFSLADTWKSLCHQEKADIVFQLGEVTRRLHSLPPPSDPSLPNKWKVFINGQIEGIRHRHKDLEQETLDDLSDFLGNQDLFKSHSPLPRTFLHTELMRDHVFVEKQGERWRITALIDFEPAQIGDPEYDLASVGLFVSGSETELFRHFVRGYNSAGVRLPTKGLSERVFRYVLLHRYSRLTWYDRFMPKAGSMTERAKRWFPT